MKRNGTSHIVAFIMTTIAVLPLLCGCKIGVRVNLGRMYGQKVDLSFPVDEITGGCAVEDGNIPSGMNRMVVCFSKDYCSKCQAGRLAEYYDLVDSCRVRAVKPVFLFSNEGNMEEAEIITAQTCYPFAVYFDKSGMFEKRNRFIPRGNEYHFFLVNKGDTIIYVGNPVRNGLSMEAFDLSLESHRKIE